MEKTLKISSTNNSKQLYSVFGKLTGKQTSLILPSDTPSQYLPDKFNSFFIDKISKIRTQLDSVTCLYSHFDTDYSGTVLNSFDYF